MRSVLLSFALLLAGACAQLETRAPVDVEFDLSGRLAARYGSEAFSGNIAWRHARSADEMLITSALGAGIARIVRQGDSVVLTMVEPREYRAADAQALTEEVLGFRVPLAGLADWVRGRPSTDSPASAEYAPDGRLLSLQQEGWNVEYLDYQDKRPTRLRLTYPGIELRLAISEWR
jgi:outer membrane lipoprotein LolB